MENRLDWGMIIKIAIIAITLIVVIALIIGYVEQYSKDDIERQKYMTPLEKCIIVCDDTTTDGSTLERDCINQCFEKVEPTG